MFCSPIGVAVDQEHPDICHFRRTCNWRTLYITKYYLRLQKGQGTIFGVLDLFMLVETMCTSFDFSVTNHDS